MTMSRHLFLPLLVLAFLALTLTACEDDPILEPQTTKAPGGSYSKIQIDTGRTAPPAMNRANPANGKNPRTF
jgi:hypothetical protein